jgi:hypothetical protein
MADRADGRSRRRYVRAGVGAFLTALAIAVPVAWASDLFTDVPDSNPFHDDISAIAGAGVTAGKTCDPPGTTPTYCPGEPITREAMAAYVHRGFGRIGYDTGSAASIPFGTGWTDLATVPITVGGAASGTSQMLLIQGVVTFSVTEADACPCFGTVALDNDDDPSTLVGLNDGRIRLVAPSGSGSAGYATALVQVGWIVPAGSTTTWRLRVHESSGGGNEAMSADGELSVMSFPFASDGNVYPPFPASADRSMQLPQPSATPAPPAAAGGLGAP